MSDGNNLNYIRTSLYRTGEFEIVQCEWKSGSFSPQHDHGWSQCRFLIEEGLFENRVQTGFSDETTLLKAGDVVTSLVGAKHEFRCLSETGKTLHVYTPTLNKEIRTDEFESLTEIQIRELIPISLEIDGLSQAQLLEISQKIKNKNLPNPSPFLMSEICYGVSPEMLLAEEVISSSATNADFLNENPLFLNTEQEVIRNLGQLTGWPSQLIEGATVPSLISVHSLALQCARHKFNPDFKKKGISIQPIFKIFISAESDGLLEKAVVSLGFGSQNLILIRSDSTGKMRAEDLEQEIQRCLENKDVPLLVCATAGTPILGAIDPIAQLADICEKYGIWLHVDAAWGGPLLFSESKKKLLKGISRSQSMAFDAHKFLGANVNCNFFLTQCRGLLNETFGIGNQPWQGRRRPDAFSLWMIWKSAGLKGLAATIDRLYRVQAETVDFILGHPRLKLVCEPEFFNICVRILPPDPMENEKNWSKKVQEILRHKKQARISSFSDSKGSFLRLILSRRDLNFQNTKQILQWAIEARTETELPITGVDLDIT
jgi:sulfinoalanine decarboxylase